MAFFMLQATKDVLRANAEKCDSRSLFKDRFADPQAKDVERKKWFKTLIDKSAESIQRNSWLPPDPSSATIHARLMSRLMVDLAGGVMENANLNLDRYGLPRIPGSAVKGLARRMALQALHDWIAAGSDRPATDDACAPCCEPFATPAKMLAAIARIFGWTPEDWKTSKTSDFAWATADNEQMLANEKADAKHETFAGTIAFLEATPNRDPGLELDVLTPHHSIYHSPEPDQSRDRKKWEQWNAHRTAPDTEDPVPVYFPAVKPQKEGDYFTFSLIPLRLAAPGDLAHAKLWLAHGLELLGIGAKTNAGYGWFSVINEEEFAAAQVKAAIADTDYPNDETFNNAVLKLLNQPGKYNLLQQEIAKLKDQKNEAWRTKLIAALRQEDMKKIRKTLREKDWFPSEWLSSAQ